MFLPDGIEEWSRRRMTTKKRRTGRTRSLKGRMKEAAAEVAKRLDTAKLKKAMDDLRRSRDAAAARGNEATPATVSERALGGKREAWEARAQVMAEMTKRRNTTRRTACRRSARVKG